MNRNRVLIIILCVILCVALGALFVVERRYPEAGSEMLRHMLKRAA